MLRNTRLLVLGVLVLVALGLVIWVIDALQRLYWQLSYSSPLLAGFLIFVLVLMIVAVIGSLIYSFSRFGRSPKRSQPIQLPEVKAEAAEENLKAVQQQVNQIADEIAREALLERSRQIATELERGELRVVIFGTGSAGKTSLINALLGRIVGKVEATMGSTEEGETYRLGLRGVGRDILITDTPGILEAGVAGRLREKLARQLAVEADLLLFVVDNDLRRSELEPCLDLARIGKRSLLIFNKADLYEERDREVILARLRERLKGLIPPADILTASACPQPVRLPDGSFLQPEPEVTTLLKRMAAVLRSEGEDLIADNILLQSQRLGEETRQLLDQQRQRQAEQIVDRFQWISAGVIAVTPLPGLDLLGTAAVNAQMVIEIGRLYDCDLDRDRGRDLALSLARTLTSLGLIKGATQIVAAALQTNVATAILGRAIQGVSAAYLTRIAGRSFIEYFRQNQSWGDGGITEVVQQQFQLNRRDEFIRSFIQDALVRVVEPLTAKLEGRLLPPGDRSR
ncbi:DUF697 domain-containing protein [Synechococcus elongatus]|uniref:DUF697 domain-containing protein n=1 Tax=Synechococcus elongatus PCC 11801 TaxID=2219813 RepID=A0AAN1QNT3_SYNEL|nr:DUF697 domain-containing protein [Synechococcus elongatus]AZB72620.1 GTP-binding protein [Synechococcus elongatus PCC 11801]